MSIKNKLSKIKDIILSKEDDNIDETITQIFMDVSLEDGTPAHIVTQTEGNIAIGDEFYLLDENGERAETKEGDYLLSDGITLVVDEAGLITDIKFDDTEEDAVEDVVDVVEEELSEVELFMEITLKDGPIVHIVTAKEGSIDVNDKMMLDGVEAPANEYNTNDGRILVVGENGVINEIKDSNAEEAAPTIEDVLGKLEEVLSQFGQVKEENEALKLEVQKFSGAPSDVPTNTRVDFKKINKEERLKFFGKK